MGSGKQEQIAEHIHWVSKHENFLGFKQKVCKISDANQQTNAVVLLILYCPKPHINSHNFLSYTIIP